MDERQFNYLQEMDIPLWVSREGHDSAELHEIQSEVASQLGEAQSIPPSVEERQPPIAAHTIDESPQVLEVADNKEVALDWDGLQRVVSQCQLCPERAAQRSQTIFGVGNPQADWLIVGDAPGTEEDRQGEPFVGQAGQLLNAMLLAIGLKRSQVYIANILKCTPPNNRDSQPSEITACSSYLKRQIELIQPKMILVVSEVAAQALLNTSEAVGELREKIHQFEYGSGVEIPLVVTYHPAYLIRAPQEKAKSWYDLKLALSSLEQSP
ncbi:MAG: uracil-DNA glycosylase [Chromatiales bacterium]|nr:uracil-DNA glycosylase [Chromatiales bacterium]